jgi:hypothetical protein
MASGDSLDGKLCYSLQVLCKITSFDKTIISWFYDTWSSNFLKSLVLLCPFCVRTSVEILSEFEIL